MKCPKCGKTLLKLENGTYICGPDCKATYTEKELQDILDAKKIEEDTEIWKQFRKFH